MLVINPKSFIRSMLTVAAGFSFFGLTNASAASAGTFHTVKLGWDAVSDSEIEGYRVYVGGQSGLYTTTYDTGTEVTYPVGGLEFGKTYYFAVKTIGVDGSESDHSSELAVTISPPPLPGAAGMQTLGGGQTGLQWTFPKSALGSSPEFIIQSSPDLVNWTRVDTVTADESIGSDAQNVRFSWPVSTNGGRKFFRLTAENWLGTSVR